MKAVVIRRTGPPEPLGLAAASGKSKPLMLRELMSAPRPQPIKILESSRGFFFSDRASSR